MTVLTVCSLRSGSSRLQPAGPDRQAGSQGDPAGLQRGGGDAPGDSTEESLQVEPEFRPASCLQGVHAEVHVGTIPGV